jgi:UDP-glucose 4-epimerase
LNFSGKRFLVTGGAGFIGSTVAEKLYRENAEIVILDDFSVGRKANISFECDVIEANVADSNSMRDVGDVDYILHFAAPSSVILFNEDRNKCLTNTIVGLSNAFEYARTAHVKKIVFPSSGSVYGTAPMPQSETGSAKPMNLYGVAKLACENIARLYADDVDSVGLRIFAGYGPGDERKGNVASVVALFAAEMAKGSSPVIYGDGMQSRDFVYISDVIEAILRSVENDFSGIVNVGSGESHTFNEVVDLINRLSGTNVHPKYVNKPVNYLESTKADITRMRAVLSISPTSLEDGLKKYLESRRRS